MAIWVWTLQALSGQPELLGATVLACTFDLRHAFDPDHLAATDKVARKLMQEEKPQPWSASISRLVIRAS